MKVPTAFVRLHPTILYIAPTCYGKYTSDCDKQTGPCPVRNQCIRNEQLVIREIEVKNNA